MKNKKIAGFTLVELLVVIAIIGLLTVVGTMITTSVRARARDAKRSANVDQLVKVFDLYINQTGGYPVSADPVCINGADAVSTTLKEAKLLGTEIKDPIFTDEEKCYRYTSDEDGASYAIRYFFESKAVGTPGYHTVP
ncbi:MAG: type II secretion system protein [Parcubacteria group bacterium]|nr:type II secretion system protein [Parcubacteria group bacterium]